MDQPYQIVPFHSSESFSHSPLKDALKFPSWRNFACWTRWAKYNLQWRVNSRFKPCPGNMLRVVRKFGPETEGGDTEALKSESENGLMVEGY